MIPVADDKIGVQTTIAKPARTLFLAAAAIIGVLALGVIVFFLLRANYELMSSAGLKLTTVNPFAPCLRVKEPDGNESCRFCDRQCQKLWAVRTTDPCAEWAVDVRGRVTPRGQIRRDMLTPDELIRYDKYSKCLMDRFTNPSATIIRSCQRVLGVICAEKHGPE